MVTMMVTAAAGERSTDVHIKDRRYMVTVSLIFCECSGLQQVALAAVHFTLASHPRSILSSRRPKK